MKKTQLMSYSGSVKHSGQNPLLDQLIRKLGNKEKVCNIDLVALAEQLSALDERKAKTVFEIIKDYRENNIRKVETMGNSSTTPYQSNYDKTTNSTSFDLKYMPDNLVCILNQFIILHKTFSK